MERKAYPHRESAAEVIEDYPGARISSVVHFGICGANKGARERKATRESMVQRGLGGCCWVRDVDSTFSETPARARAVGGSGHVMRGKSRPDSGQTTTSRGDTSHLVASSSQPTCQRLNFLSQHWLSCRSSLEP